MSSDKITRLPPPPDMLRMTPTSAVQPTKREKDPDQQPDDPPADEPNVPTDPQDEVVISDTSPVDFDHPDNPDAYYITIPAVFDLLDKHKIEYPLTDFTLLHERLAFLQSHSVPQLYWPPHLTLQQAIAQACQAIDSTP